MAAGRKRRLEPVDDESHTPIDDAKRARTGNSLVVAGKNNAGDLIPYMGPTTSVYGSSLLKASNFVLEGHSSGVFAIEFSPSGKFLASGDNGGHVFLWRDMDDSSGPQNSAAWNAHKRGITSLSWSGSSSEVATVSGDSSLALSDVGVGAVVRRISSHGVLSHCSMLKKGEQLVAVSCDDGAVRVFDPRKSGKSPVRWVSADAHSATAACLSDEGTLWTGGIQGILRHWDLRNPTQVVEEYNAHDGVVTGMEIDEGLESLLTHGTDGCVKVWDVRRSAIEGRVQYSMRGSKHSPSEMLPHGCAFGPTDSDLVAAASADRMVYVWDRATETIKYTLGGHSGAVLDVAFHPTHPVIASSSTDGTVIIGELVL